jgi:hypothetical protein
MMMMMMMMIISLQIITIFFLILLFIATMKTQGILVCTRLVTHAMLVTGSNFPNFKKRMFKYANILKPTRKI